jgi:hypothetical protein
MIFQVLRSNAAFASQVGGLKRPARRGFPPANWPGARWYPRPGLHASSLPWGFSLWEGQQKIQGHTNSMMRALLAIADTCPPEELLIVVPGMANTE